MQFGVGVKFTSLQVIGGTGVNFMSLGKSRIGL